MSETSELTSARTRALEAQIAELKRRWPAHSVPAALLEELDELEEALATERQKLALQEAAPDEGGAVEQGDPKDPAPTTSTQEA